MNLKDISKLDENGARAYLEAMRWPDGPRCAHCGDESVKRLSGKAAADGLFKCRACRKKFSAMVGTIFHRSHVPLRTWLLAFALLGSSKKGISAKQLQRSLGLGCYQTAWHMAHRIRHVMRGEPLQRLMLGDVECDEVYIGGAPRYRGHYRGGKRVGRPITPKMPVITLVERGGELRARTMPNVTAANLARHLAANVDERSRLQTDELQLYRGIGRGFKGGHGRVEHGIYEFVRGNDHVNTAESFHALMRRGLYGSFHAVSKQHLDRYVDHFEWLWNHRRETDSERTIALLKGVEGRRLQYADTRSTDDA